MSAISEPKQARSELSTRRLLDAAACLIAEQGYERTTLAAIGARAGYSHGLVTRRFGSKDGLLWALVDRMVVQWGAEQLAPSLAGAVGVDALRQILDQVRASVRRSPSDMRALYSLMFEALTPIEGLRDRFARLHADQRRQIERVIRAGIETGVVRRDVDPRAEAMLFLAALRGATYQWMLDPDDVDIESVLDHLGVQLERTLRARRKENP